MYSALRVLQHFGPPPALLPMSRQGLDVKPKAFLVPAVPWLQISPLVREPGRMVLTQMRLYFQASSPALPRLSHARL